MRILKPRRLHYHDVVGVAAPASPPPDPKAIDRSVAALQSLGFRTRLAPNVRKRWGFLAGTDQERASDLMTLFADKEVNAIFCLRGGYGAGRVLPLLDYKLIRANPKILLGYSDITALHCALLRKAGLVSFHGPMLNSDLIKADLPEYTRQSLLRTLMRPAAPGSICQGYRQKTISVLRPGCASGRLVGGNISLLCAALGTPFEPSFKRKILFFEEVDERPYRLDRMLTQVLAGGRLRLVAGIAVGINRNCNDPKAGRVKEYRQSFEDVLRERLLPLGVPLVIGLPFGHVRHNATLPVGARARLDAEIGDLVIMEPGVG
jgi:muramoyltetrapeptide carboxypeptidase